MNGAPAKPGAIPKPGPPIPGPAIPGAPGAPIPNPGAEAGIPPGAHGLQQLICWLHTSSAHDAVCGQKCLC